MAWLFVQPLFFARAYTGQPAQPPLTPEGYLRDIVLCDSPQLAHLFRLSDPNHSAYEQRVKDMEKLWTGDKAQLLQLVPETGNGTNLWRVTLKVDPVVFSRVEIMAAAGISGVFGYSPSSSVADFQALVRSLGGELKPTAVQDRGKARPDWQGSTRSGDHVRLFYLVKGRLSDGPDMWKEDIGHTLICRKREATLKDIKAQ